METDQEHEEANIFASYLLMPEGMFEADVRKFQGDPKMVSKLCLKYGVDQNVLAYRIKLMAEDEKHEKKKI